MDQPEVWTLQKLLHWSTDYLESKGVSAARYSAETLLAKICNFSRRLDIYLHFDRPCSTSELQEYKSLLRRRIGGEPLGYITGEQNFLGLDFHVGPGVLVPRFDTEVVAMEAVEYLRQCDFAEPVRILDLCCGSGALGIAVAILSRRACQLTLADVDEKALTYCRENVLRHLAPDICTVVVSDFLDQVCGTYHIVLCNPPYLDRAHMQQLEAEVRMEPPQALAGGPDGLDFYRRLQPAYTGYLLPEGRMFLEAGYDQQAALKEIFQDSYRGDIFDNARRYRGAIIGEHIR